MYIVPTAGQVKVLVAEKSRYDEILTKTKELSTLRDSKLVDYNNIPAEELDRLNKVVPENFNSVLFINDLNSLAAKYKLAVVDFQTNSSNINTNDVTIHDPESNKYKINTLKLTLSGQYADFVKFLSNLETGLQLVDVSNLDVLSGSKTDGSLDYSLEIRTYSLK